MNQLEIRAHFYPIFISIISRFFHIHKSDYSDNINTHRYRVYTRNKQKG